MAYSSNGGYGAVPATATNLVDWLVSLGIASPPFKANPGAVAAQKDQGQRAHVTYHMLALRAAPGNSGTIYFGHTSAMTNTPSKDCAGYLAAKDPFTEDLVEGMGALEGWWIVGSDASQNLFCHWTE